MKIRKVIASFDRRSDAWIDKRSIKMKGTSFTSFFDFSSLLCLYSGYPFIWNQLKWLRFLGYCFKRKWMTRPHLSLLPSYMIWKKSFSLAPIRRSIPHLNTYWNCCLSVIENVFWFELLFFYRPCRSRTVIGIIFNVLWSLKLILRFKIENVQKNRQKSQDWKNLDYQLLSDYSWTIVENEKFSPGFPFQITHSRESCFFSPV